MDEASYAIPTFYNGVQYRSMLEANWAGFLDELREPHEYEKQHYEVEPGLFYLPDFWLPNLGKWLEIKPGDPTPMEQRKVVGLHKVTGYPVLIFGGFPKVMRFQDPINPPGYVAEVCNFGVYVVDDAEPDHCRVLGGTCNDQMLRALDLVGKGTTPLEYSLQSRRIANAVKPLTHYGRDNSMIPLGTILARVVGQIIDAAEQKAKERNGVGGRGIGDGMESRI